MMIWRKELNVDSATTYVVALPAGSRLLSAAWWKGDISVWATVDPTRTMVDYRVCVVPTGRDWPWVSADKWRLLGLVLIPERQEVYHVFEVEA